MTPLYTIIHDDLLALIENGTYSEGELIPSEEELAEMYDVSKPTARRAVQGLINEGYLVRNQNRGTIVQRRKIDQAFAIRLRSFDEEMHANGLIPETKVIYTRCTTASKTVAGELGIKEGDPVFRLVRLRYADGSPNVLVESVIPLELYPHIAEVDFTKASLYAYFKEQGNPALQARRRLEVAQADNNIASLLDTKAGKPIFHFTTTTIDAKQRVVEYSVAYYRGENNAFELVTGILTEDSEKKD
jgi:GntR family transcriptional regulator